jgi:hypothetical protein
MKANKQRTLLALATLVLSASFPALGQVPPAKPLTAEEIRQEESYTIGVQAYVYGYPVVEMYKTRYDYAFNPARKNRTPLNQLTHRRQLVDPAIQTVVSPNNDTLYSAAWLDLAREPILLQVPESNGRYYAFQLMDFFTNNFATVGKRTTGTKPGVFAVVGPGWKGSLPEGVKRLDSPTNAVWLLGRTLVDGKEDLPNVHALQDRYKLTPLSARGKEDRAGPDRQDPAYPPYDSSDPLKFFEFLNAGLHENPPPAREAALMSLFGRIGVGPDKTFRAAALDRATAKGLDRAVVVGKQLIAGSSGAGSRINGWYFPPKEIGAFGDNYLLRAEVAMKWLASLSPEEAVYFTGVADDKGRPLSGKHRYLLRFEQGQLPPAEAFWSVTMYRLPERFLVDNPVQRYAIGDRTKGLRYGPDGSLEIYVQHESPGKDKETNWLPAAEGDFNVILRAFLPGKEILEGTWKIPPLKRIE